MTIDIIDYCDADRAVGQKSYKKVFVCANKCGKCMTFLHCPTCQLGKHLCTMLVHHYCTTCGVSGFFLELIIHMYC